LNAVIGMTELVLKSPLSVQQREYLGTVRDSGEALLGVINDILDFSKIEAGKMSLERVTFPLWESLGDTMKSFSLRAHQKGLELAYRIQPDVPRFVVGDYTRLRQIVVNLVGNAVKFTDQGEVVVEVARESGTDQEVVLHITISDTGIGIPADKQTLIFEMFEQADTSMSRRHGGTGLGLAIASRLVDLMNGRIWVESEVGRGSRFHFTVDLGLSTEPLPEPNHNGVATLRGLPVLVVDDNATNRRILEEILRSWNMMPTTAAGAAEAIQRLREAASAGTPFPLMLTDAQMPDVDGFSLIQQVKRDTQLANTVVIMLTSGGQTDEPTRCQELGIAAQLLKPVKPSELLNGIGAALGISPTAEMAGSPTEQLSPIRRILLAEDSIVNQKLAVALLESRGHEVAIASTGRETLAAFESQSFDLILMDVQMPEMDGLEATAAIRARERQTGGHVPIIAMTAHALSGDRQRCLDVGMDGYIAKPVRAAELFQTIDALFHASSAPAPPPKASPIDWPEAMKAVQGDREVLRMVVEAAVEEVPKLMDALRQAVAKGDAQRLRLTAHTLKGSLRCFGAKAASELVWRIEALARDANLAPVGEVLALLETEIHDVYAALCNYLQAPSPG
jgi:CheY-like chemotaxis protein/anti-sigma regulatory factor (Ser/Thr protein kinase)